MRKTKVLLILIGALFVASAASFLITPENILAEEKEGSQCFLVSIRGKGPAAKDQVVDVKPQYLAVAPGSCVIFINWVRVDEIMVSFEEGKTCADVTRAPSGFGLDAKGCYVTDYLPMGKTSSLRFMEPGVYRYVIKWKGKLAPVAEGQITVNKP